MELCDAVWTVILSSIPIHWHIWSSVLKTWSWSCRGTSSPWSTLASKTLWKPAQVKSTDNRQWIVKNKALGGFWRADRCWFLGTTESRRCWSGSDRQTDVLRYVSEERCLALRLCGWISRGNDLDVEIFLRTLEQEREWERAAAVALFNLDIRRAIQILNKGATAEKGEWVRLQEELQEVVVGSCKI